MQSSGEYRIEVSKILFYNESDVLYKTLLVSQMQIQGYPQIVYGVYLTYSYTPQIYSYTFPANENFADAGRIEFKGAENYINGNPEFVCNNITYNSSIVTSTDKWIQTIAGLREVTKTHNIGESELTATGTSLSFYGNYNPIATPPAFTSYTLNDWSAGLSAATPGSLNVLSVLPVSLSSYYGSANAKSIMLRWETAN